MRTTVTFLVSILGFSFAPALMAQEAKLVGHWEGAVVLAAAEQEADVVVDFNRAGGLVKGQLGFPLSADGVHEVGDLVVKGSHVSFSVRDKDGVISSFDGGLSPDGASVQGTMKESGRPIPFTLRRINATPAREVSTYRLLGDGIQLKSAFNGDIGKTRILLVLNPGSFSSKMAMRVVQRYVMEQINDPNLRVYIVWMAPDMPDVVKVVRQSASLAKDPRVTHFWSTDRSLVNVFEPMLASYKPVSNPCLLFAPEKSWTATPPVPDRVRQSFKVGAKSPSKPGQKLNGIELATDVQILLATKKGR
ncbi:MAG TPA: hypothetical protein VGS07_20125 [Thermoanaerobaculia bacterium]|jgi:hypothetical protein|nr:hypothetical protein [Thermoanaerobaculia bacterium]